MSYHSYEQTNQNLIVLSATSVLELNSLKKYITRRTENMYTPLLTDYLHGLPLTCWRPSTYSANSSSSSSVFSSSSSTSLSSSSSSSCSSSLSSSSSSSSSHSSSSSSSSSSSYSSSSSFSSSSLPNPIRFSTQLHSFRSWLISSNGHCLCKRGFAHILFPSKNLSGQTCWVYAYFNKADKELVIMQRQCDSVYEILSISSSLKCFINIVLPKITLKVTVVLWTSRDLCARNSGFYAIKQFWINANLISNASKKPENVHYLSLIRDYLDDEDESAQKCFLKVITTKQSLILRECILAELFPSKNQNRGFWIPEFLLKG